MLALEPTDRVFTGLAIKGVPAFLAMVGDTSLPHIEEAVGYLGEYVVLTAASLGLSTCWVSATFRPEEVAKFVALGPAEKIFAVSPLGYEGQAGLVETFFNAIVSKSRTRKPLEELLTSTSLSLSSSPEWVKVALEAARLAPSAYNRQPWRFTIGSDRIRISVDPDSREVKGAPKRMDCGMAMMHLELGALVAGFADALKIPPEHVLYYTLTYLKPGCSQMAVLPGLTADGHVLMARNYDFTEQMDDMKLCTTRIKGKFEPYSNSAGQLTKL